MKNYFAIAAVCAALSPAALHAQSISLQPANPQPSGLSSGLAVSYASLASGGRSLADAKRALKKAEPGEPLRGLSYDDTKEGDPVLSSGKAQFVAAKITGYIKFDKAGTYTLDFLNNDGFELSIGGQEVADYDGVHACGYAGEVEVNVPKAGYYALEGTYFQRKGTACLLMEWGATADDLDYVPDSAFYH